MCVVKFVNMYIYFFLVFVIFEDRIVDKNIFGGIMIVVFYLVGIYVRGVGGVFLLLLLWF